MSMIRVRLKASVSLFMAILVPAVSIFFLTALAYGERRIRELDLARAAKGGAGIALASFDRGLWRDYGLWGLNPSDFKKEIMKALYPGSGLECSLNKQKTLYQSGEVKRQIIHFMRLRAPVLLGQTVYERLRLASEGRKQWLQSTMALAVRNGHTELQAERQYQEAKNEVNTLSSTRTGKTENNESGESGESQKAGFEERLSSGEKSALEDLLFSFADHMLPVYEALGTEKVSREEAFAPSCIERLADKLDRILDAGQGYEMDRLCLAEYVLHYFPAASWLERGERGTLQLTTPDGRELRALAEKHPLQAEMIAAGMSDKKKAVRYCESVITGLRFIPHYIAANRDTTAQAKYRSWAKILSVSLGVLSLGQVHIPPEALRYFVQAADCLSHARKDLKSLKRGDGVLFWPRLSLQRESLNTLTLKFYYRDYLRIVLLTQDEDKLASGIEAAIRKLYDKPYLCSFTFVVRAKEGEVSHAMSYIPES